MSAKGYISFESFKTEHPTKTRLPRCPRCKKPMASVMTNIYGKHMCADCFKEEIEKMDSARRRREQKEQQELANLDEERETFE